MPRFNCTECGRGWAGLAECHCATCHLHFLSVSGFDRHRLNFECLPVAELERISEKTGRPRMVRLRRMHGDVWVERAGRPPEAMRATQGGE